jgi:L-lactate dehydrogenase complex protein LldE
MAGRVALFPTCVVDTVAADVGVAAYRVLRRLGYDVVVPEDATCCGQPAWNAGFASEAAKVARTTLAALEPRAAEGPICVPAGSCATMIRVFWPELFEVVGDHDARDRATKLAERVKEFSELVAGDANELTGRLPATVAYHHSCHMLRELGVEEAPVALLERLDGCKVANWSAAQRCCGFGGLFSVKQPETSVAMADDKLDALAETDAEMLVGCDQSCLLHLEGRMRRRGSDLPVRHLAQVLDDAMGA